MANYLRKAILGAGWTFLFSLWTMLASYLFRLTLAHNLSTEQYGLFYSVLSLVVTFHLFRDPGLRSAVIKFIPEFLVEGGHDSIKRMISMTFLAWTAIGAVLSGILIALAGFLAQNYFKAPEAYWLVIVLAVAYVLIGDWVLAYTFQGFQRLGLFASVDALRATFFLLIAFVGFMYWPGDVLVAGFAYMLAPLILMTIYAPILKFKVFPKAKLVWGLDTSLAKRMVLFGLPVTITGLSFTLFQQSSILMLTYFGSLADVGLLNIALPTAALLLTFSSALLNVVFPLSSELWARGLKEHMQEGIDLLYRYSIMGILPIALVLVAFAELIIRILFGAKYVAAAPVLMVLGVGTLFWVISNINFTFLAGIGRSRDPVKVMVLITVVAIVSNALLIPLWGLMGAAYSIVLGYLLAFALSLVMLRRYIKVGVPLLFWVKCVIAAGVFLGCVYALKKVLVLPNSYLEAGITLAISGVVYALVLLLLRMTSVREIKKYVGRSLKR